MLLLSLSSVCSYRPAPVGNKPVHFQYCPHNGAESALSESARSRAFFPPILHTAARSHRRRRPSSCFGLGSGFAHGTKFYPRLYRVSHGRVESNRSQCVLSSHGRLSCDGLRAVWIARTKYRAFTATKTIHRLFPPPVSLFQ